jgi:uncharacterized Fe-S cluster-containing radical SAM superfamily protein
VKSTGFLDSDALSINYRVASIDLEGKRILVTNFRGTEQEKDLSEPPNCDGNGRIRHFRRGTSDGWPDNPLPIEPACRALGLIPQQKMLAQVFQNAACNWRCWYCYVPFKLLGANEKYSKWLSCSELIDLYLSESDRPKVIDLTGGQPDLTPEWVIWIARELKQRGLDKSVYLWSDDNLSNDYFWRYTSESDREFLVNYGNYGRVCCFKGYDDISFSFNTQAEPALFERQFALMDRLLTLGIDLYAYVTFTSPSRNDLENRMVNFVDRLQQLNPNLPLRTVPLEIQTFTPMKQRLNTETESAIQNQHFAIEIWQREIENRFTNSERECSIVDIPMIKKSILP